jgi:peroxiredoxin
MPVTGPGFKGKAMLRRFFVGWLALALLSGGLLGCATTPSPEQAVALTATAASHLVATRTPDPANASTATPVPRQSEISSETGLTTGTQVGQMAPDFTLRDSSGQMVSLSDFRGRPVVMIFWASWCPYCKEELPLLQEMSVKYGEQGLVVLGVDLLGSKGETQEKALAFVKEKKISFPILFDEGAQVFRNYLGRGIPILIFVDRDGIVASNYPGAMAAQSLEAQIQRLVAAQ